MTHCRVAECKDRRGNLVYKVSGVRLRHEFEQRQPQSKAHQRVWLRMHHFIHVLGGNVHQATRPPGHEQRDHWSQCALTNDSYVAAIQMSRLADHGDSISHYEF